MSIGYVCAYAISIRGHGCLWICLRVQVAYAEIGRAHTQHANMGGMGGRWRRGSDVELSSATDCVYRQPCVYVCVCVHVVCVIGESAEK